MPYLCIVFFIVLDLRLTRLGLSGAPFFFALNSGAPKIFTNITNFANIIAIVLPERTQIIIRLLSIICSQKPYFQKLMPFQGDY